MSRRGWLFFLALGAIWGLPYLLIRISVREVSPAFLVFVRTGGGALLLAPFVVRRGALRPLLAHWKPLVAYSVAEIAIPWWLLFTAEKRVTSSLAGLLVAAVPIAGAVIARVKGTDHLDRRRVAGLALGMAGVGGLVGFGVGRSSLLAASSFLIIVTGYALGPSISRATCRNCRAPVSSPPPWSCAPSSTRPSPCSSARNGHCRRRWSCLWPALP